MQDGFKIENIDELEDILVLDIIEKMVEKVDLKFYDKATKILSKLRDEEYSPIYTKL